VRVGEKGAGGIFLGEKKKEKSWSPKVPASHEKGGFYRSWFRKKEKKGTCIIRRVLPCRKGGRFHSGIKNNRSKNYGGEGKDIGIPSSSDIDGG